MRPLRKVCAVTTIEEIIAITKQRPGEAYIIPDGSKLFIYIDGPNPKVLCVLSYAKPFTKMTEEEVNEYICHFLR